MSDSRPRRRLAIIRGLLASPRDLWLLTRMAGWALVVPVLKFLLPLPRLVRLVAPRPSRRRADDRGRVVRLTSLLYGTGAFRLSDNCLERSLVTFRYLATTHAAPTLVVGMRGEGDGYLGHAWVTVDGAPVHDPPSLIATLAPIVAFTADGRTVAPAEPTSPAA
jgi:transglutaminase superfamily protein